MKALQALVLEARMKTLWRYTVIAIAGVLLSWSEATHASGRVVMSGDATSVGLEARDTTTFRRTARKVPGQYIVKLRDETADVDALVQRYGGQVRHRYRHALKGFSVRLPEAAAIALSQNPAVELVEEDGLARSAGVQQSPPWGLDRIDQRDRPLSASYAYPLTGAFVNVYVLDDGLDTSEWDIQGRAVNVFDALGANVPECFDHGTHVASIIGGTTYGVAKNARIHGLRVMECTGEGSVSDIIAGVEWVTANHVKPAVANMSMEADANTALDDAVRNSIQRGVTYVVAAGNGVTQATDCYPIDAGLLSPARVANAITVGAINEEDSARSLRFCSNHGSVVDFMAPGKDIPAYSRTSGYVEYLTGTSAAAAHVTGVVALYLQSKPDASVGEVLWALLSNATTGKVTNLPQGTPNGIVYAGFISSRAEQTQPTVTWNAAALPHSVGRAEADGWSASTGLDDAGFLHYGPYTSVNGQPNTCCLVAAWEFMIDNNSFDQVVLTVEATVNNGQTVLARRDISRSEFFEPYRYQTFTLPFPRGNTSNGYEFRVYWHDVAYIRQRSLTLREPQPLITWNAATQVPHAIGRAEADGWAASTALYSANYLQYGPYTDFLLNFEPGFRLLAGWELMVDNSVADNNSVLDLNIAVSNQTLAHRNVTRREFGRAFGYQMFYLPFTVPRPAAPAEFRVYWKDTAYIRERKVALYW